MIRLSLLNAFSIDGGSPDIVMSVPPKELALLAYLAIERPRGFRPRDQLVGLLWAETDQERARSALRKSLTHLRHLLGDAAILSSGKESVAVAAGTFYCDALAFDTAVSDGSFAVALELYTGDLMPGAGAAAAKEFEEWVERERNYYRDRAINAARKLVEFYSAAGERTNATQVARTLYKFARTDELMFRKVLGVLARFGDRAGAMELYADFAARLERDLEVEPSRETRELIQAIRSRDSNSF